MFKGVPVWEHTLGWLVEKRARQPLNGLILTLDLPDLLTADKRRREYPLWRLTCPCYTVQNGHYSLSATNSSRWN
ncbi:type VI secretion protein IcmF/TssM N-terminal domain-containing protein [Escherichia fergusonii]